METISLYKEELIIQKLGDKWDQLGLSLKDIYGIEGKKKKGLPEFKKELKLGEE